MCVGGTAHGSATAAYGFVGGGGESKRGKEREVGGCHDNYVSF